MLNEQVGCCQLRFTNDYFWLGQRSNAIGIRLVKSLHLNSMQLTIRKMEIRRPGDLRFESWLQRSSWEIFHERVLVADRYLDGSSFIAPISNIILIIEWDGHLHRCSGTHASGLYLIAFHRKCAALVVVRVRFT